MYIMFFSATDMPNANIDSTKNAVLGTCIVNTDYLAPYTIQLCFDRFKARNFLLYSSKQTIKFSGGYDAGSYNGGYSVSNGWQIPYRIYGIK